MATTVDQNLNSTVTIAQAEGVQVTGVNTDNDQTIDKVKVDGAPASFNAQFAAETDADGYIDVTSASVANAVNAALGELNLAIGMNDELGQEVVANLSQPSQLQFASVAKTVSGHLVLQTGSANNYADVQGQWADFISNTGLQGELDVNALVQAVLREAYLENTKDLHFYAQKVKFYNELKDDVRSQLTEMRKLMSLQAGRDDLEQGITLTQLDPETGAPVLDANGNEVNWDNISGGTPPPTKVTFDSTPHFDPASGLYVPQEPTEVSGSWANKEDLEQDISNLEEFLNAVGDDAQLENADLPNMLQKQQQTLQMMSNISKMLHDTAMSVIRKIGG